MSENENQELDLVELVDDDGAPSVWQVLRYLFYNGDEYAILYPYDEAHPVGEDEDVSEDDLPSACFAKVTPFIDENGEEMEELVSVQDEAICRKLLEIMTVRLGDEEDEEES